MHTDAVVCSDVLISQSCCISDVIIKCSNILFQHLGVEEELQCVFVRERAFGVCLSAPTDAQEWLYFVMLPVLQAV